jgi:AraC-like DNA-binding protein
MIWLGAPRADIRLIFGQTARMGITKPASLCTIPSASGGIARLACTKLRAHGADVKSILVKAGLAPEMVENPTTRLEARAQVKLLELAAQELGDDLFGFHLAHDFDVREIGLVYYVMASSERLADALLNAERYSQIVNEGVRLRVTPGKGVAIALDYVDLDRRLDRHHIEFWLVALVRICREIADSRFALHRLKVRHTRPTLPKALKSFFGVEVEFGCNVDEITLSPPVACLPAVRRDSHLNGLLHRYAKDALGSRPANRASIRLKIERILPELLPHGKANTSEVARALGTSSRSLSRKLRQGGASFSLILEELRQTFAEHYLSERELPISEIAWLLGYREVSSFTHAFRRWTGTTPRRFRSKRSDGPAKRRTAAAGVAQRPGRAGLA